VDDDFVKDYYAQIPGCTTKRLGTALYNVIPVTATATPQVELDIGGHLFTLERWHLPQAATQTVGSTLYYVGAIQPKSLLMPAGGVYRGPDLIGRVSSTIQFICPDRSDPIPSGGTREHGSGVASA
jgi:hypothetical protein